MYFSDRIHSDTYITINNKEGDNNAVRIVCVIKLFKNTLYGLCFIPEKHGG